MHKQSLHQFVVLIEGGVNFFQFYSHLQHVQRKICPWLTENWNSVYRYANQDAPVWHEKSALFWLNSDPVIHIPVQSVHPLVLLLAPTAHENETRQQGDRIIATFESL